MEDNVSVVKQKSKITSFLIKNNTYIMLVGLFVVCALISGDFFTEANLVNIGRQSAGDIFIALGMLLVILTGGIDLSVGSIAALGSVMVAFALTTHEMGMAAAIALPIAVGLGLGFASGFLVAYAKMAPFITTLAMMTIARGLAFIVSNGQPVATPADTIGVLGTANVGAIPTLFLIAVIAIIIFAMIQKFTSFGRIVVATGSNETAVQLAGIPVRRYKMAVYAISGMCAAIAGIVAASRTAIGTPIIGTGWEMNAIAACVIGGASLSGGEGSPLKTVIGVLILALIGNIMNLLAVASYPQDIIKGVIIIASVLLQTATSSDKKTS